MAKITVVGSGASGVHFALSALEKGHRVEMFDVGYSGLEAINPEDDFLGLKSNLKDPAEYFLGEDFESVVPPDFNQEIYEFPPNKMYIFRQPPGFESTADGFEPLFSFARGGLAEAWTGGCYPFNDEDLQLFPFKFEEMKPFYEQVARRIGLIGVRDDMSDFFPWHDHLLPPLDLDENSTLILKKYEKKRQNLNSKLGFSLGRSRIATLSRDKEKRKACDYSGRCLWGCPSGSLYVPSLTLEECLATPNFSYHPRHLACYFRSERGNRVTRLVTRDMTSGQLVESEVENLVLAAGTLSSSKIFLDSLYFRSGKIEKLEGLMDNRQILVPFVNLKMIGKPYNPESYQYHQLAVGFRCNRTNRYIHGQITTLKTALLHPVIQQIPLDLKTAIVAMRSLHAALGVININFWDTRRPENTVSIEPVLETGTKKAAETLLKIRYQSVSEEKQIVSDAMTRVRKFLMKLGAIAPPMMAHIRPMGASVHYSGTIPMSVNARPLTVSPDCRSWDFENLFFVDGTSFPFLPAKNLTFTLMANAVRVAGNVF
jgi:hypothetical protein